MPTGFVSYGTATCPQCHAEIELTGEADQWEEQDDGGWKIVGYSPPAGVCGACDLLIADDLTALRVYDLSGCAQPPEPKEQP